MRATRKITISMPADMAKEVKRLAKRENITMSGLFREAFRRYQPARKPVDDPEAIRRVMKVVEDAKRNPMHPDTLAAELRKVRADFAAAANKTKMRERDIVGVIHGLRARGRAS